MSNAPASLRSASAPVPSDEDLMLAYAAGDERAFRTLFEHHAPRLQHMLRRRLPSKEVTSDLVQQTFLQVHRNRRDFRSDGCFRSWLYTIAANLVRDYYRRRRRRPETSYEMLVEAGQSSIEAVVDAPDFGQLQAQRAQIEQVRGALKRLSPTQRRVIELHWLEDQPFREVAEEVGKSVGAVKVQAHRGYKLLRSLMTVPEAGATV